MDKTTAERLELALQYADDRNQSGISGHVVSNVLAKEVRRLQALTHPTVVTPSKPDDDLREDIKDAFMEGIAIYELGPCDGTPMSEEQREKCWELSDAKNRRNLYTSPRPHGPYRFRVSIGDQHAEIMMDKEPNEHDKNMVEMAFAMALKQSSGRVPLEATKSKPAGPPWPEAWESIKAERMTASWTVGEVFAYREFFRLGWMACIAWSPEEPPNPFQAGLLDASKAVLDWYNNNGSVGMADEVMAVLGEAIEAQGKDGKG